MDDSDNDAPAASPPASRSSQAPIGGMVRDPRDAKTPPSLTRFVRARVAEAIGRTLVAVGLIRPRHEDGTFGPRSWKRLGAFLGAIFIGLFVWTSIHIVAPGSVAVPVTFGHPSQPLKAGLHITLPFTTTYSMSIRTQNYTMSSHPAEGQLKFTDDSVAVLGADGGAASVNATVLYRLNPRRATDVYKNLGTGYSSAIVRPSARSCIRLVFTKYGLVEAATTQWDRVEFDVATCMKSKLQPRGLLLQDFQLREVALSRALQMAVNAKVASQQNAQQQKFELATAEQAADITRIQALATADSQQILACGGKPTTADRGGQQVQTVIPNPLTQCSQAQLTPQYLQFTYIQALKQLVSSPNNSTLILPFDQNLTPLIQIPGNGSSSGSSSSGTTPGTTPGSTPGSTP